jgi:hypothetical protein
MNDVNVVRKRAGTILSDGIDIFFCVFMASVRKFNCHTVSTHVVLTSALVGGEWSVSHIGRFTSWEIVPVPIG